MSSLSVKAGERLALGVDTGGTFTDFFLVAGDSSRIHKVLSTPNAPERAILQGIDELGLNDAMKAGRLQIVHGSTVATNAALEGKGVKTAFITNKGFADMLALGRQNRPDIYALQPAVIAPPVPANLCIEVDCRRDARGQWVTQLSDAEIDRVSEQIRSCKPQAVAINLLFSYLNGEDERRIAEKLPKDLFISCSHEVLAEYKEYERGIATWLNAWLGPIVESYLQRLNRAVEPSALGIMQSSGGTMSANMASRKAVNLLLSGPAGGLAAAEFVGRSIGNSQLITFDMGGTSTDVALMDGGIRLSSQGRIGPYPVAVPMVDIHTIGAGGGSLAFIDEAGMLHVGPESAGASPGPACYGQGGGEVTVTDANAYLGRIRPEGFLGGHMRLDLDATRAVLKTLAIDPTEAAMGVIALANEHMASALRVISIQRGYDPVDFELCCFGGAGGLHVCALAEELAMKRIVIPACGGVLSAVGMLTAAPHRNISKTVNLNLSESGTFELEVIIDQLKVRAANELRAEGISAELNEALTVDLRYKGQTSTLNVPYTKIAASLIDAFHKVHKARYGHSLDLEVELVNLRVQLSAPSFLDPAIVPVKVDEHGAYDEKELPGLGLTALWNRAAISDNDKIDGPAIICEKVATTLVGPGWQCTRDHAGHLRLQRKAEAN